MPQGLKPTFIQKHPPLPWPSKDSTSASASMSFAGRAVAASRLGATARRAESKGCSERTVKTVKTVFWWISQGFAGLVDAAAPFLVTLTSFYRGLLMLHVVIAYRPTKPLKALSDIENARLIHRTKPLEFCLETLRSRAEIMCHLLC